MRLRRVLSASVALLVLVWLAPGVTGPSRAVHAQDAELVGLGEAFGTLVSVDYTAISQKTAKSGIGCSLKDVPKRGRTVSGVDASPLLTTGTVHTTAARFTISGDPRVRTTSEIENISLLDGLLTISSVKVVSATILTDSGFRLSSAGSELVDVRLAGVPLFSETPPPNTEIDLVGIGRVVFNARESKVGEDEGFRRIKMVKVIVEEENPLAEVGTRIIVASAASRVRLSAGVALGGAAFGSRLTVDDITVLEPSFVQFMPCVGTDGEIRSNTGTGVDVSGVLTASTVHNTAQGTVDSTGAEGTMVATIEDANVLVGLVTADLIRARTHLADDGVDLTRRTTGTRFAGLQVEGFPEIVGDVPRNTRLDIVGLGTLWLKRISWTPKGVEVRMIQLKVLEENDLGLPVGSDLRIGVSRIRSRQ